MKWEYHTEVVKNDCGGDYLVPRALNKLGEEGWELVSASAIFGPHPYTHETEFGHHTDAARPYGTLYVFKRPKD